MIAAPSVLILFLTAILSCVGIAVLRNPRHQMARKLLALAAALEFCMATGLAWLVIFTHA